MINIKKLSIVCQEKYFHIFKMISVYNYYYNTITIMTDACPFENCLKY